MSIAEQLADEIYGLHCDIGRLETKNAMLQTSNEVISEDHAALCEQNAKLRSICAEVAGILFNLDVDYCGLCDRDSINHPCPVHTIKGGECLIESELRELGIEVS